HITYAEAGTDAAAATAVYQASYSEALLGELAGYGGAEVDEATLIGEDEVTLTTAEAATADALAGETVEAQEALGTTISDENAANAEAVAGDEAGTTTDEGVEEIAAEEVTSATNLAGAEADYAIAMAQVQAAAAASFAAANPSDAATFASLYAQGYVQWLTDLKPAFVADAAAVAQAAAQDEEDLVAADVEL